ncbi:MAG TPA: polysaccharide deacetylase family protein, partial [Flavobacteriales bacterium]|nr:polysaccharide deacetylase family protein [Flavobacteriales bacterium]
ISAGGFTIGSHGLTHASMTGFGTEDRFYEMAKSRAIIEQEISKPVLLLAFPFGRYNRSCQFAAKLAGYTATYTTRFSYNTTSDGYVFHRWSVKYHTNIVEFERVINGNPLAVLNKKARSTANYLAGKLNLQLNLKPFKAANV